MFLLTHSCSISRPDLVDFSKLNKATPESNMEYAFHVAETELGVPRLLDVEGKARTMSVSCRERREESVVLVNEVF